MGKLIVGYWDCGQCGSKQIKGHLRECPACGKARGDNTKFYMMDTTAVEETIAKGVSKNPDWKCSFCGQLNSDQASNCKSCGSSKADSEENYFEMRAREEKEAEEKLKLEAEAKKEMKENSSFSKLSPKHLWLIGGSIAAIIVLIVAIFGINHLLQPKKVIVTGFAWDKTLEIEAYQTVSENGWSLPKNARLTESKQEIYQYDRVIDHYETVTEQVPYQVEAGYHYENDGYKDLGNGYFEEQTKKVIDYETRYKTVTREEPVYIEVPVYEIKYYYDVERWMKGRSITSSGKDQNDYVGEHTLAGSKGQLKAGDEREGSLTENFYIFISDEKGKEQKYRVSEEDWHSLKVSMTIKIKVKFGFATIVAEEKKEQ